ncbi:hypothetical protein A9Q96_10095 [Rhodobacterales bacterium 52_120_T64]|nr:hypothetical protein A9Q96_10095 [Rhodobacterales bacterium 52_120_T64]
MMRSPVLLTEALVKSVKPETGEYVIRDLQCPGLILRVQPSGTKSWIMRVQQNGKSRRITIGNIAKVGVLEARGRAHAILAADTPTPPTYENVPPAITFAKLADDFLKTKEGIYKPTTIEALEVYLNTQLLPAFGNTAINRLTTPDIANWFHTYSQTRPGGANQALGHLTTILAFARQVGHLSYDAPNPCAPIRKNRRLARGRLLTSAQIKTLGVALDQAPPQHAQAADAIRLILLTGCRSGEILRLKWSEVKSDRLSLTSTKTGPRDVMLAPAAVELLGKRQRTSNRVHVFPSSLDPTCPVHRITSAWVYIRTQANLPKDIRLHDLRHTYASHAIMRGESVAMAGQLLGHARTISTQRYSHLDGQHLINAAERVSKVVAGLLGQGL